MDATPPYSPHAEIALLGAAIVNPDTLNQVDVAPDDFYIHRHRMVWQALRDLAGRGINPDFVTLSDCLDSRGQLEEIGGMVYLTKLINDTPSSMGYDDYATIVKDKASRRRMIQIAEDIVRAAYRDDSDLGDARTQAITGLVQTVVPTGGAVHISHYIGQVCDEVDERVNNPQEIWGIPTGFKDFDFITGGLHPGEVVLLSGEPGMGKTKWAGQIAINLGAAERPGAFYSLEMRGRDIVRRMVSAHARIETRKLKSGKLTADDWPAFTNSIDAMAAFPMYLSDATNWRTDNLRADLSRLKRFHGIEWFIVDYLNLMMDGAGKFDDTERSKIISRQMKSICKDLDLAGIVIQSMNKEGMGGGLPSLKALSGASQVAFDADLVCFLVNHIPDSSVETPNPALRTVVFGKGRELANPRRAFHLLAFDGFPAFGDVVLEKVNLDVFGKNGRGKR